MAVVFRNSIQEITLQALQFIHSAIKKSASCGVILAPSAKINPKTIEQAKVLINKTDASLSVQLFYDDANQMLCAVLDSKSLGGAHYTALVLKDFLQKQQLLEGRLIVSSFPESGAPTESTFEMFLQQAIRSKGKGGDIHFFTATNAATSVLIADTDDIIREFIKIRLELKGYRVYEATDGVEAYNEFVRVLPDLVITELNLPIMDGYQLIRNIERNHSKAGKVIVLTDKQLSGDMSRAYECGAADYVTKPLSISELEWKIKRLTKKM